MHGDKTYDLYVGADALKNIGKKRWNKRVQKVVAIIEALTHYDHLYIGGGNSRLVTFDLPSNITLVSNEAGIDGGARLWGGNRGDRHQHSVTPDKS